MARDTPLDWVLRELDAAGVEYRVEHGTKHAKVRFLVGGTWHLYVGTANANGKRSPENARARIRRMLRHLRAID